MLRLRRIEISEFRPYGETVSFDLPSPGVTVLVGPNGLGKSAFFEAIEWCLTGRVERLEKIPADRHRRGMYGRIAPGRNSSFETQVSLHFDGRKEGTITRTQSHNAAGEAKGESRLTVVGAPDALILLQDPKWQLAMSDSSLSAYLRSTHLLAQSGSARLISDDAKKRWSALSQLNGAGLLDRAQNRLLSRATTTALDDEVRDAEDRLLKAQEALERWTSLILSRDSLISQAAVEGAIAPSAVALALGLDGTIARSDQQIVDELARARRTVAESDAAVVAQISVLDASAHVPARYSELTSAIQREETHCSDAARHLDESRSAGVALEQRQRACAGEADSAARALEVAKTSNALRRRLQEAEAEIDRLDEQILRVQSEFVRTTAALQAVEGKLRADRESLGAVERLHRDYGVHSQRTEALEALRVEALDVASLQTSLAGQFENVAATRLESEKAEQRRLNVLSTLQEALLSEGAVETEASLQRRHADQTSLAVAAIAAVISEMDVDCPVCQTVFAAGELKHRAVGAAQTSSRTLAQTETRLALARDVVAKLRAELATHERELQRCASVMAAHQVQRGEVKVRVDDLRRRAVLIGVDPDAISVSCTSLLESEVKAIEALRTQLQGLSTVDVLRGVAAESLAMQKVAESAVEAARVRLVELLTQKNVLLQSKSSVDLVLSAASVEIVDESGLEEVAKACAARRDDNQSLLSKANEEISRATEALRASEAKLKALRLQLAAMMESWLKIPLEGLPSEEALAIAMRQAVTTHSENAARRSRFDDIGHRWNAWKDQQRLATVNAEVAQVLVKEGVLLENSVARVLLSRIEEARGLVDRCERARAAVDRFRAIVKSVTDDYYEQVVAPLNILERSYTRALTVRTPFSVEWATRLSRGITHLELQGRLSGVQEAVSAGHVLSEGQLSATALSQLMSLSTGYRWSDWRALLLDDPVQHNDVLHISAFADVMRNLVLDQSYQIVVSTHDPEIAEFVARKLTAAGGVELSMCRFQAVTDAGVQCTTS